MKKKDLQRLKLIEYLADPHNDFPTRTDMALQVLEYKQAHAIYMLFTVEELDQIEQEALEIRRKRYAASLAKVDAGLLKKAAAGDAAAAKLVYQRFEGWSEKLNVGIEQLDKLIEQELARIAASGEGGDATTLTADPEPGTVER